jgi:hypothetical protein
MPTQKQPSTAFKIIISGLAIAAVPCSLLALLAPPPPAPIVAQTPATISSPIVTEGGTPREPPIATLRPEVEATLRAAIEREYPDSGAVERWELEHNFKRYAQAVCGLKAAGGNAPASLQKDIPPAVQALALENCKD